MGKVKKAETVEEVVAPKKATAPKAVKSSGDVVSVKNISAIPLSTSKGTIQPGDKGEATIAELHSWSKYLERA